jgi:hypothetical protein
MPVEQHPLMLKQALLSQSQQGEHGLKRPHEPIRLFPNSHGMQSAATTNHAPSQLATMIFVSTGIAVLNQL